MHRIKIYKPNPYRSFFLAMVGLALGLAFGGVYLHILKGGASFNLASDIMFSSLALFFLFGGIVCVKGLVQRLPTLTLTMDGIEYCSVLGKRNFWAWKDVGPFKHATRYVRHNTIHYLCALHDLTHDSLERLGQAKQPHCMNADVIIEVNSFKGFGEARIKEMEAEINRWREEFGSPGNDAEHLSLEQVKEITAKLDDKVSKQWKQFFVVSFIVILVLAGYLGFLMS